MEHLAQLRALMDADRWIERVRSQREHLPEAAELASVEGELRELLAALHEAQASAEPLRRAFNETSETAQRLASRAGDLERAATSATGASRDLAALQRELDQVRERLAAAEDDQLNVMLELEPLDEEIAAIKERAQPGVARRAHLHETITQLRDGLDEEIAALRATREEIAQAVDPQWRRRYESAMNRVGISGAALLDGGRCDGCRIALAPLDVDRVTHAPPGEVLDCPECGRLLLT